MKINLLNLTIAAVCGLPFAGFAQGTYLSAPDGNPTNALIVAPGGNIGIGTTTPGAPLEIFSGFDTDALRFGRSSADHHSISTRFDGSIPTGNYLGFNIEHSTGDTRRVMTLQGDGNVGIGTTSPQSTLHVMGSIMAEGTGGGGQIVIKGTALGGHQYEWYPDSAGAGNLGLYDRTAGAYRLFVESGGNVGIGTTTPQAKLDVAGKVNCTVLELTSDRAQKGGFAPVDNRAILDRVSRLPITTWHYINEPAVRHLGPVAQDFKAAFNVGSDDKHIATVDADGVLFAAVQALNQELEAELQSKDARIDGLEKEVASLASRLATLEKIAVQSSTASATSEESDHPTLAASSVSSSVR